MLALNLYVSILAYVLRAYSRSRVADLMPEDRGRRWLDWLDRYEEQLQVTAGVVRLCFHLAIAVLAVGWYWQKIVAAEFWATSTVGELVLYGLLPPVAATVVLLMFLNIGLAHALAIHTGEAILARSFALLATLRVVLWPLAQALMGVDFIVRRLLGKAEATQEEENERLEEEILDAISEGKALGAVDEEQEEMIEAVFKLHDTAVSAIMTPRTDIIAIPHTATVDDIREIVLRAGHSRVPVYEKTLDQIVGVLYVKDLITAKSPQEFSVGKMMRAVPYVPETKTIDELLREFQQRKVHIAIVLDEYGGTAGLVTIEDILEELVGEIDDEYDKHTPPRINRIDDDTLEVDARVHVSEINEELDLEDDEGLPENGEYDTVGGFVFTKLGKIPVAGEELVHDRIQVRVLSAEARKINRLRIHVAREARASA